ncbi:hypothetical protein B0H14DRAFT_398851 [Mycena olivaceomarginata]|nr:hypothetical protein B0H14DRAFT_398851 [Mycena olivaceomarginata]
MPPRRPTAWEVSFPDEVQLPLEGLEISRPDSTSPLKRKSAADEINDALQRANKRALRLPVAYYNPPPGGLIDETAEYIAPGEDPSPDKKPDRVLYNFCIFEPDARNELVSLEVFETSDNNRQFAAVGIVLLNDEDDEDYGQEDGADAIEDIDDAEKEYVRLNNVSLCAFDYFSDDAPVFIETPFATYELRGPSTRYKPYFMDFLAPRRVARAVLMNVLTNPQEDLKQFRIGAPQFSKEGLREAIPYLREVLEEHGDVL